jgi:adenylyl-sulfate kinase
VGKSTLAEGIHQRFTAIGQSSYVLDGDVLREGLCSNLGFSPEDRHENIRRAGHVARILQSAGVIAIAAFITPYAQDRSMLKNLFAPREFIEVHVDCPIEVCQARDPKALYQKARAGLIPDFTGISQPYEVPEHPDLRIRTDKLSIGDIIGQLWAFLTARNLVQ